MSFQITNLSDILKMGKGQLVPTLTARVAKVNRPWQENETDRKYGWSRQLILLSDTFGNFLPATLYSEKMHLKPDNEGEIWRFRCMNGEKGPSGIEINRWTDKKNDNMEVTDLKIRSDADLTRFAFRDGKTQNEEIATNEQTTTSMPAQAPDDVKIVTPQGTEARVTDDLTKFCEMGYEVAIPWVADDIAKRQHMGIAKYGVTVEQNQLTVRQWLQHAYEEQLDAAIYHRRAVEQIDIDNKAGVNRWPGPVKLGLINQYKQIINQALALKIWMLDIDKDIFDPTPAFDPNSTATQVIPKEVIDGARRLAASPPPAVDDRQRTIRYVARYLRFNYQDDRTDEEAAAALSALEYMRDWEITWDELYDCLVARDRAESPDLIDRAFDNVMERLRLARPDVTPDQVCQAIVKSPSTFREIIEEMKEVAP